MKMKFRNCLVILLALLILITVFPAAYATPKINEAESSPLSVQINTNKNSYGTLGTAQVDVVVTNVSSETVYDVNVQNILPAQLMAFGMEDLTSCVDKLEPGKNISISFEACLNPNSAAVNAFIKFFLKLKVYFKTLNDSSIAYASEPAVINGELFDSISASKEFTFGKTVIKNTVLVSYLALPSGTSTGSVAEITAMYNKAANRTKAYPGEIGVKKSYGTTAKNLNTDNSEFGLLAGMMFSGGYPAVESAVFDHGASGDNTLKSFLPPEGSETMSTLTAAGIKSASCITIDGGKLIVINLIREKYNSLDAVPVYHSTCMDTPKLSPGDLAPFVVKNGAADYTGATIIAIVNNEGYLSYLNIREPVILSGTFTYDDLPDISFDVATVWKQSIAIAYS